MNPLKVRKGELLTIMRANREQHRETFERALAKYHERMVEHLAQMLDDAKNNRPVSHRIDMPIPEDHTGDYDRVIKMLELAIDEEIVLHEQDANCYVMDQWAWSAAWAGSTVAYLAQ
jgi:hypothetical protein